MIVTDERETEWIKEIHFYGLVLFAYSRSMFSCWKKKRKFLFFFAHVCQLSVAFDQHGIILIGDRCMTFVGTSIPPFLFYWNKSHPMFDDLVNKKKCLFICLCHREETRRLINRTIILINKIKLESIARRISMQKKNIILFQRQTWIIDKRGSSSDVTDSHSKFSFASLTLFDYLLWWKSISKCDCPYFVISVNVAMFRYIIFRFRSSTFLNK